MRRGTREATEFEQACILGQLLHIESGGYFGWGLVPSWEIDDIKAGWRPVFCVPDDVAPLIHRGVYFAWRGFAWFDEQGRYIGRSESWGLDGYRWAVGEFGEPLARYA